MITNIPDSIELSNGKIFIEKSNKSNKMHTYYNLAVFLRDEETDLSKNVIFLLKRLRLNGFIDRTGWWAVDAKYQQIPEGKVHAFLAEINKLYFEMEAKPWGSCMR